ncbi:MAG: TerC family protein [Rhodospirillales bacterium]|nr:TerC family protein [Rhodospirillales bacterium]
MEYLMDLLATPIMGKSLGLWSAFLGIVATLLVLDLGVLNRKDHTIGVKESLKLSAGYITIACLFGVWVWNHLGRDSGIDFYTGYLVEQSLSIDNLFVMMLIFKSFSVPDQYQHRVLFWGIIGVIVMRAIMIGLGAAIVSRFDWVLLLFGAFLFFSGVKMLFMASDDDKAVEENAVVRFLRKRFHITEDFHGHDFFVHHHHPELGRAVWHATPLFLALVSIEIADLIFAVDSVPAVFAITTDPYIVYTSNIFAILGLRSLYFALAAMLHRFIYLKYALSLILVFIGAKVFYTFYVGHVNPLIALGVTFALLSGSVFLSLLKTREDGKKGEPTPPKG